MIADSPRFNLMGTLWSALLILVLSTLLTILLSVGYGLVVGFETRGDQAIITERVTAFASSFAFVAISALLVGLVAFWRGRVFARTQGRAAIMHILVAVAIALLVRTLLDVFSGAPQPLAIVGNWIAALAGGYAGAVTGKPQAEI